MQVRFWAILQPESTAGAAALADFSEKVIVADNANLAHIAHGMPFFVFFWDAAPEASGVPGTSVEEP